VDVVLFGEALRFPQGLVEPADRRSTIPGNKAGGVEATFDVTLMLQCRIGNLTSASMPVMKARPVSSEYLSSRETFITAPDRYEDSVILYP